jgi:hypothetical protein
VRKSSVKSILLGFFIIVIVAGALSYVLTGQKWPRGATIRYRINANTTQVGNEDQAIKNAANSWSRIFPAGLRLVYAGSTSTTTYGRNGSNTLCWRNEGGNGVLARTYWWYYTSSNITIEADTVYNDYYNWSTSGSTYDIETVTLHEMGHWVGLAHSSTGIMRASYSGIQRKIDNDAKDGFLAMYWFEEKKDAPKVSITSPKGGAVVSKLVKIEVDASDDKGVKKVEFYIDNVLKHTDTQSPYDWNWDTARGPSGNHTVKVKAYDTDNQTAEQSIQVTVDQPPTISITSPSSGNDVYGFASIRTRTSDDFGVPKVKFFVNGQLMNTTNKSPHVFQWNTNDILNGKYTVEAIAFDTRDQTSTRSVTLVRIPHAPLNFSGTKYHNNSVLLEEYLIELKWVPHNLNRNISVYRIYRENGANNWTVMAEVSGSTHEFLIRNIDAGEKFAFMLKAVDSDNREGESIYLYFQ